MTVYFHGNFGLNREYMAGVLKACLGNPHASADEIAKPFGYKAPFTARYRSWLNKTGIASSSRVFELTPIGEIIWDNDPKLESLVTQWLLHHELTNDEERAEAWHYLAHDFLPNRTHFTSNDLRRGLSMKLMSHHPTHFGSDAPMIKVICRKMIQCYTEDSGLGMLQVFSDAGDDSYVVNRPNVLGPWASLADLLSEYQKMPH
jgi:hypothetical protein